MDETNGLPATNRLATLAKANKLLAGYRWKPNGVDAADFNAPLTQLQEVPLIFNGRLRDSPGWPGGGGGNSGDDASFAPPPPDSLGAK